MIHEGHRMARPILLRLVFCAALLLVAVPAPARAADDPLEAVNRRVHAFNQFMRTHTLGPLAEAYHTITTPGVRHGVSQALANLSEPITAVSSLAAGEFDAALNAVIRFGINSTIGLGGVRDSAGERGYPRRPFSVADALCSWGVPSGPFLVLPMLGPSTLRDAGALLATTATLSQVIPPELVIAWSSGDMFVGYARLHHDLGRVDAESLDSYAVYRSAYLQRRAGLCVTDRERLLAREVAENDMAAAAR